MMNVSGINPNSISDMHRWHKERLFDEKDMVVEHFWRAYRHPLEYRFCLSCLAGWSYSRRWLLDNGFSADADVSGFLTEKEKKTLRCMKNQFLKMIKNGHPLFEADELQNGISKINEMLQMA